MNWIQDIYLNFSTGFYMQGVLQLSRRVSPAGYFPTSRNGRWAHWDADLTHTNIDPMGWLPVTLGANGTVEIFGLAILQKPTTT